MSLPDFFLDRVTAEIRQQMEGVQALTGRLDRQRLAPDAKACIAGIGEAAAAVNRILESASDLKAASADGLALRLKPVRLRELADAVQERWQPRATQAAVTLLVSYDGDPEAAALADPERLLQV